MRLLPRNEDLFAHLREQAGITREAANRLYKLCSSGEDAEAAANAVAELERRGSEVMRKFTRGLRESFITPLDRNDMHGLGKRLDDLLKTLNAAAWRVCCYRESVISGPALALCETQRGMIECVTNCIDQLAEKEHHPKALETCGGIDSFARNVDPQLRDALTELLAADAPAAQLFKRKDIYDQLKRATELCEEIAEIITNMLLDE